MTHPHRHRAARALVLTATLVSTTALAQADLQSGTLFSSGNVFEEKDGPSIYRNVCQGCHMPDAKGAVGAGRYPALAGNTNLASAVYPAIVVANGLRSMPPFAGMLDDEQIAAVVNYVRTHFGNAYTDSISAATVKTLHKPLPTAP